MASSSGPDGYRSQLRLWGKRRRAQEARRDPLVRAALEAGVGKDEIHVLTGLGRSTIDRIAASGATVRLRERPGMLKEDR
jgi:DNA invertase Pin-like site-specific DNA recombinase